MTKATKADYARVIAEARAINAEPAQTAEEARQKSDRLELLLTRLSIAGGK